ncbi:MAG: hypothetical protein AAGD07_25955 [Planctomycetota bacterium]
MNPVYSCLLVASLLLLSVGCGDGSGTSSIDTSDSDALAAYEEALAEADAMTEGYEGDE